MRAGAEYQVLGIEVWMMALWMLNRDMIRRGRMMSEHDGYDKDRIRDDE